MKIGILIRDFSLLENFELRIIDQILNDPALELGLLIKDGRIKPASKKQKIIKLLRSKNILGKILFKIQYKIESRLFKFNNARDKDKIISILEKVECIELSPTRKGFLDVFSTHDSAIVKQYNVDILLRHEFSIIRGDILNAATHGIWSFHHGDNSINRGGPAGFWEIVLKQPVVGVTLQKLTSELDGGLVLDKGFFNRDYSYLRTYNKILEGSVSILFKNINKLQNGSIVTSKSGLYYNPLYRDPGFYYVLKYIFHFYKTVVKRLLDPYLFKFFGLRSDCWTLFIGKGPFLESTLYKLKPVELPKNQFWADPFLFNHNNEMYTFFENYDYKKSRGKISCGKVVAGKIENVTDVLDLKYHLSYPFVFKEEEDIYMIPETQQTKRIEIYKCTRFPDQWELFSTAMEGESVVDTTYFKDDFGQRWLFLCKGIIDKVELYIYKIDSLKMENLQSHKMNPICIDARNARSAGPLFKYNGNYYRPSQFNAYGIYGFGLNINVIKKLNLDEYLEETVTTIEPNFRKGIVATHHVHQLDNIFILDACYKRK